MGLPQVSFSKQVCPVVQCCLHCNVSLPKASSDWATKDLNGQSLGRRDRQDFQGEIEEEKKNFTSRL